MTTLSGTDVAADAVRSLADEAFGLCAAVDEVVSAALGDRDSPRRADLHEVEGVVRPSLKRRGGLIHGAGFVSAPALLADAPWWLEWFARGTHGHPERLLTDTDPEGEGFYDYTVLPWWTVPSETGAPHITGPYVDYVCTEDYTLTFTRPVTIAGRFVGVAGADVRVASVEAALLPVLRRTRGLVLVNSFGRVVVSSSPRHVGGSLVRDPDVAGAWQAETSPSWLTRIDDLPLGLIAVGGG
ncbi:MAG: cache domain-containing protein [Nocardioidaceae bacterium]